MTTKKSPCATGVGPYSGETLGKVFQHHTRITDDLMDDMSPRPLNVGLVGGGKGAFIVHPHQRAIHFDGTRRVTAGALFPDPKVALKEAAHWPYPIMDASWAHQTGQGHKPPGLV